MSTNGIGRVFLSYNSRDASAVETIANKLDLKRLDSFFDCWEIRPGDRVQETIENAIRGSKAMAVFLGPEGVGKWEKTEIEMAIRLALSAKEKGAAIRIVPVFLPGLQENDERIPLILTTFGYVIFKTLDDEAAFKRLWWGLTGENELLERTRAAGEHENPAENVDPVSDALRTLVEHLHSGSITFFLGRAISGPAGSWQNCEIAVRLLQTLQFSVPSSQVLLPPSDLAGSFYGVAEGDVALERRVEAILQECCTECPKVYVELADLLHLLAQRPPVRGRRRSPALVVSTCQSLLLERCLLQKGISFSRFVQYRSAAKANLINFEVLAAPGGKMKIRFDPDPSVEFDPNSVESVDEAISVCVQRSEEKISSKGPEAFAVLPNLLEPILYKLHGSLDLENSCTLSTEHYFETAFSQGVQSYIPDQINQIIANGACVFIGANILDPDFRHCSTLLTRPLSEARARGSPLYGLQRRDEGDKRDYAYQMRFKKWTKIRDRALSKYGIEMLDISAEDFIAKLCNQIGL